MLSDYSKFWALAGGVAGRFHLWRLDFTKTNELPRDFTPHGAAAVIRSIDGSRRFSVWDGLQLHGDIGERLGLKYTAASKKSRGFVW